MKLLLLLPLLLSLANQHRSESTLLGGYTEMDRNNPEDTALITEAVRHGAKLINEKNNAALLRVLQVIRASKQPVAGWNYKLDVQVDINGQLMNCTWIVGHVTPWIKGGTWTIKTDQNDPCSLILSEPRKKRAVHLLGGENAVDVNDESFQQAASWAVEHINKMSNSLFLQRLSRIAHATKQVVNGVRYRFLMTTVSTLCRNKAENHKNVDQCPLGDDPKYQDCVVSVISTLGKYTMEDFSCKPHKGIIGGDGHDYLPHGKDTNNKLTNMIGGDGHDYQPHGSDTAPKHSNVIGGDGHDYLPHGKDASNKHTNMIGGDGHDYLPHGKDANNKHTNMIGGDGHDYLPHGKDANNKHANMIGGDGHDYLPHGKDTNNKHTNMIGGDGHDYLPHGKDTNIKHMNIIGGGGHDYLPHTGANCAEHVSAFKEFKNKYNRLYASADEETLRFKIFCDNMEKVKAIQAVEQGSAQYGATIFADLSEEEFRKHYLGFKPPVSRNRQWPQAKIPEGPIPESWDWRDHNAVTPVKNQGWCGSCWAFSTTGNIEGQWAIHSQSHQLLSLSEQELVDCDKLDQGCNGGFMYDAYEAVIELGGIETESDYKYTGQDQKCQFNRSEVVVKLTGAVNISKDEGEMAAWLYKNGPISIGINSFPMQFYMWGIAHPWKFFCDPNALDHGVLIVGYGKKGKEPYWIIKNSWGPKWGREGYYYIYRGDGSCGLNTMCSSATVD